MRVTFKVQNTIMLVSLKEETDYMKFIHNIVTEEGEKRTYNLTL